MASSRARILLVPFQTTAMNTYEILNTNTHTIGFGDPVEQLSSGYIDLASGSTSTILGIFAGCTYVDTNVGGPVWRQAWTEWHLLL